MSAYIQMMLAGASLWTFTAAFTLFMAVIANFVSSTVGTQFTCFTSTKVQILTHRPRYAAAIIILPVVASVGKSIGNANLMIIASVLMDSAASEALSLYYCLAPAALLLLLYYC